MLSPDEQAFEARCLVSEWRDLNRIPSVEKPIHCDWESDDRRERLATMAWTGNAFQEGWSGRIHEVIGQAFSAERMAWAYQRPFYHSVYCQFFTNVLTPTVFNAVVVMPSRVPVRLRGVGSKTRLTEKANTNPKPLIKAAPLVKPWEQRIEIASPLCGKLQLLTDSIVWTGRPAGLKLATVETRYLRTFGRSRITGNKLFQADLHEDADALIAGSIPALRDAWGREGDTGRVDKPLIHLWRLDAFGMVDILVLETDGPAAGFVSTRWAREELATVMLPHPQQAMAVRAVLASRKRLFL